MSLDELMACPSDGVDIMDGFKGTIQGEQNWITMAERQAFIDANRNAFKNRLVADVMWTTKGVSRLRVREDALPNIAHLDSIEVESQWHPVTEKKQWTGAD
jgi:hypothetical protein